MLRARDGSVQAELTAPEGFVTEGVVANDLAAFLDERRDVRIDFVVEAAARFVLLLDGRILRRTLDFRTGPCDASTDKATPTTGTGGAVPFCLS